MFGVPALGRGWTELKVSMNKTGLVLWPSVQGHGVWTFLEVKIGAFHIAFTVNKHWIPFFPKEIFSVFKIKLNINNMVIYQQGNYKSKSTLSVMTFTLNKSNCHILTTGGEKRVFLISSLKS